MKKVLVIIIPTFIQLFINVQLQPPQSDEFIQSHFNFDILKSPIKSPNQIGRLTSCYIVQEKGNILSRIVKKIFEIFSNKKNNNNIDFNNGLRKYPICPLKNSSKNYLEILLFNNIFKDNSAFIKLINHAQTENQIYEQFEFPRYGTLLDFLNSEQFSTFSKNSKQLIEFLKQIIKGVKAVHQNGLLLRSLTPFDVFIFEDFKPKISNLSNVINQKAKTNLIWPLEFVDPLLITESYVSNDDEVIQLQENDIYLIGNLIYFITQQKRVPFGTNEMQIIFQYDMGIYKLRKGTNRLMARIIEKCFRKQIFKRPNVYDLVKMIDLADIKDKEGELLTDMDFFTERELSEEEIDNPKEQGRYEKEIEKLKYDKKKFQVMSQKRKDDQEQMIEEDEREKQLNLEKESDDEDEEHDEEIII